MAANGQWTLTLSGLSVAAHAMKAKALYGTGAESAVRRFTIIASVAPTITSIKDSKNVEIPPDGFTVDTSVVLTGTASAGLEVEVFDGAVSQDIITANASGQWTLTLTGMSVARHDMKVRANYASNPESAVRKFTVTAVMTPTLTRVDDPQGSLVSNGGSTFADAVTASGKASIGQSVEVFDGASSKGTASVNASGDWSRPVSGLSVGAHSLTAKALYASNPVSSPWTFNVQAATVPTLSVRDSRGEIAQGGTTTETTVTASGTAVANEQVEVFDASTSKGTTAVGGTGGWSLAVAVALGAHSIKVVGKYADSPSSGTRDFTVVSPIPDFVLDPTPVSLNGGFYAFGGYPETPPLSWPAGTTLVRTPTSGVPPYVYSSSNDSTVRVDQNGGIYSASNGTATITVQDKEGRQGSYTVTVSNVTMVHGMGNRNWPDANQTASSAGRRMMNMDQLRQIFNMYGSNFPMGSHPCWSTDSAGLFSNRTKDLLTGVEGTAYTTVPGGYCFVMAI